MIKIKGGESTKHLERDDKEQRQIKEEEEISTRTVLNQNEATDQG